MPLVLLRAWPSEKRKDVIGVQKLVSVAAEGLNVGDGDLYCFEDLDNKEVSIEKRPDERPDGTAFALHFLLPPRDILSLANKGWTPVDTSCTYCRHQ